MKVVATRTACGVVIVGCAIVCALALVPRYPAGPLAHGAWPAAGQNDPDSPVVAASAGRVEGAAETVEAGVGVDGILAELRVSEGQFVEKGDILAMIETANRRADLDAARAELSIAEQNRIRLARGRRDEERRVATEERIAAQAIVTEARLRLSRYERLERSGVISRQELDDVRRESQVAEAGERGAIERERLAHAGPLPEEIARADAEIAAARERVRSAQAMLDRCAIRAPLSGTVLRCNVRVGEAVTPLAPRPVVTLADISRFRVRAELDERDIGKVRPGQEVLIVADVLGDDVLRGYVSRIEPVMGRKTVRSGDPAEKSDRDVREVIIELDDRDRRDRRLVVGLRVTARFMEDVAVDVR